MLLRIGTTLGISGDVITCPNYAVVDYVRLCGIFVASPNDHTLTSVIDSRIYWSIDAVNLTFDTRVMSRKSGERIHVNTNLPVYKVYILANYIVESFGHVSTQPSDLYSALLDGQLAGSANDDAVLIDSAAELGKPIHAVNDHEPEYAASEGPKQGREGEPTQELKETPETLVEGEVAPDRVRDKGPEPHEHSKSAAARRRTVARSKQRVKKEHWQRHKGSQDDENLAATEAVDKGLAKEE